MENDNFLKIKFTPNGFIEKVKWVEGNNVFTMKKDIPLKIKPRKPKKKSEE